MRLLRRTEQSSIGIGLRLASLTFALVSCAPPDAKLPVYDSIPAFEACDSNGRPFGQKQMEGAVWVVDFIYSNCPAACPLMSSRMRRMVAQMRDKPGIRFLSISVDPARDTPPVLKAFAERYGGGTARWVFLSADPPTVHKLAYETFHVGDVLGRIEHSTKFMIVDRRGRIRGYYSSGSTDELDQLREDVDKLRGTKA